MNTTTEASKSAAPTYEELVAALRALDGERRHTMHKPAGRKAYDAVVMPREIFDANTSAILARLDAATGSAS